MSALDRAVEYYRRVKFARVYIDGREAPDFDSRAAAAELERLRKALEPFADVAGHLYGIPDEEPVTTVDACVRVCTVADLRAARAALLAVMEPDA